MRHHPEMIRRTRHQPAQLRAHHTRFIARDKHTRPHRHTTFKPRTHTRPHTPTPPIFKTIFRHRFPHFATRIHLRREHRPTNRHIRHTLTTHSHSRHTRRFRHKHINFIAQRIRHKHLARTKPLNRHTHTTQTRHRQTFLKHILRCETHHTRHIIHIHITRHTFNPHPTHRLTIHFRHQQFTPPTKLRNTITPEVTHVNIKLVLRINREAWPQGAQSRPVSPYAQLDKTAMRIRLPRPRTYRHPQPFHLFHYDVHQQPTPCHAHRPPHQSARGNIHSPLYTR